MRQRLPGLELGDGIRVALIPGAQRFHGFLGLAAGCHDQHNRSMPRRSSSRRDRRAQTAGCADDDAGVGFRFGLLDVAVDQRLNDGSRSSDSRTPISDW
jgi:hypothetical protein